MIKLINLAFIILLLNSCSSGPKKTVTSLKKVKKSNYSYSDLDLIPEQNFKKKLRCKISKSDWESKDWKHFVHLGNSCLQDKKYKELLEVANYISINYSDMPWGPFFKSHYFTHKKLNLKSLWLIDLSIEKAPNLGLLHYQKAILLHKLKYIGAAKASAQKAVEINPKNFGAQTYLASLYLQSNQVKLALKHALQAKDLIKKDNQIYLLLSDIYFEMKDYKNAIVYLSKVKRNKKIANDLYFKLAYSYENLQQRDQSIGYYKKIEARKKANLLNVYGLDVNEKIKEMEVEIAKLETKKRQPSNSDNKDKTQKPLSPKQEKK